MPKESQPANVSGLGPMTPRQCSIHHVLLAINLFCVAIRPWFHIETRKYKSPLFTSQDLFEEAMILLSLLANSYVYSFVKFSCVIS